MIILILGLVDLLAALFALIAINVGGLSELATVLLWLLLIKGSWTLLSTLFQGKS